MNKEVSKLSEQAGRCFIAVHAKGHLYAAHEQGFMKQYKVNADNRKVAVTSEMNDPSQIHEEAIHEIAFNWGGDYFAICCEDGDVVLFRHPSCAMQQLLCQFDCPASSLCFDRQKYSLFIIAANERGKVKFVNIVKTDQVPFEYEANKEGVRCVRYLPIKTKSFRERLFATAGCDGRFTVFKINQSIINDSGKQENEKIEILHDFPRIFPRIKGTDSNQRLLFDACANGKLIAIPGNHEVTFIGTDAWEVIKSDTIKHNHPINCVKFKSKPEEDNGNDHILAVSDTDGNVSVWNVNFDNKQMKCSMVDQYKHDKVPICNVDWFNDILIASGNNGHVYSYQPTANANTNTKEVQNTANNTENAKEQIIEKDKKVNESDSDDDFDIDMGEKQPEKKIVLRKKPIVVEEKKVEDPQKDNSKMQETNPRPKESISSKPSPKKIQAVSQPKKESSMENDMAAMAEIFGGAMDPNNDARSGSIDKTLKDLAAVDITSKNDEMEDVEMEDDGEDLKDFIVHENANKETSAKQDTNDKGAMDTNYEDDTGHYNDNGVMGTDAYGGGGGGTQIVRALEHEAFQNGCTGYDDDGQRYLLFNEIGGVIARKPNESKNSEMNNIMMSMTNNEQFSYEIEFFDKSKYNRAVRMKSNYEFTKCNMNAYGIILGSCANNNQESVVKYRPIKRNDNYRSFASEKDCEWTYILPQNEECVAVAVTHKYSVIATNKRYLRILSVGGLQTHQIYSLPRNVVNICANICCKNEKNIVAITFADLSFWVLDLDGNKKLFEGHCDVSNDDAHVKRIFMIGDHEYKLVTVDSCNVVRMLNDNHFGSIWVVIMDIDQVLAQKYPSNSNTIKPKGVWPVGFDHETRTLMVMELKFLDYPIPSQSDGACLLVEYNVSLPLLNMAIDEVDPVTNQKIIEFGNREEAILKANTLFELELSKTNNLKKKQQHQKKLIKDYLMLFQFACQNNKAVMAYDIATHFLNSEKALNNAKKIAIHSEIPLLAERLNTLLAQKAKMTISPPTKKVPVAHKNHMSRLKRPSAKLGQKRVGSTGTMSDVTNMRKTHLIGKKRMTNPNTQSDEPPSKRRNAQVNPFSCTGSQRSSNGGQRNSKNSVFEY